MGESTFIGEESIYTEVFSDIRERLLTPMTIPQWNTDGVMPPILSSPIMRSPYVVSLVDFVSAYGKTPERNRILDGFLKFRLALHGIGLVRGFQWVNGSFVEDKETIKNLPPSDIDVVTFCYLPTGITPANLAAGNNSRLFSNVNTKMDYKVDAFYVVLNLQDPETLVKLTARWHSTWSHRRGDLLEKGFVEINLAPQDDVAWAHLKTLQSGGSV